MEWSFREVRPATTLTQKEKYAKNDIELDVVFGVLWRPSRTAAYYGECRFTRGVGAPPQFRGSSEQPGNESSMSSSWEPSKSMEFLGGRRIMPPRSWGLPPSSAGRQNSRETSHPCQVPGNHRSQWSSWEVGESCLRGVGAPPSSAGRQNSQETSLRSEVPGNLQSCRNSW